jgi:hypothetical protein
MSTLRTISGFKSSLRGGGARPNLFEVDIPRLPANISWDADTFKFLCDATSMPGSNIDPINIPFRGRILKVAGDRTIDNWSITVINDEDFKLRTAFEQWSNLMNKLENATGATSPNAYMVDAFVHQLGRGSDRFSTTANNAANNTPLTPLRTYKFYDIWPSAVTPIELSYGTNNEIERFNVDFQVTWWSAGENGEGSRADRTGVVIK